MISKPWHGLVPAWLALLASLMPAAAQQPFSPAQQPGAAARNPICLRLEAQLAAVDRGNVDPARADQIKRLDDAANRQQADLDRLTAQARRMGCEGRGLFSIFMEQPQQCGQLNNQIQQLRANLDRALADLQRAQGGTADREGQRRTVLASLGQNDCGPQYRNFANNNPGSGGNFFERLFGPATTAPNSSSIPELPQITNSGGYRTLCVRTCDGYYFPLSSSAGSGRFGEDEKTCQRLCPAAETALYTQRSQGEDVSQAVSSAGRPYAELPTAFAYRKQFNAACACKQVGQTWADALRNMEDRTIERGDIVVDEERARLLSLPPEARPQRPATRPATTPARATPPAPAATTTAPPTQLAPPADNSADTDPGQRTVRPVGPTFLPAR